jgi:hypothetical protein
MATLQDMRGDIAVGPKPALDDDGLERLRDLHMLALAAQGWSLRNIAKLFNSNRTAIHRRLRGIPPEVVEHHLTTRFDGLL